MSITKRQFTIFAIGLCIMVTLARSSVAKVQSHGPDFQPIITDGQFVYAPAFFPFNISEFLEAQEGSLADYTEIIDGKSWTAAEIIEYNAHFFSINPQVLLTLLELQSGVVTSPATDPDTLDYAMSYYDVGFRGLYKQINWAAEQLFAGFYARRYRDGDKQLFFKDGTTQSADLGINAGTFAIHNVLAQTALDEQTWQMQVSRGPGGFFETFTQLFGDPLTNPTSGLSASSGIPGARLPWTPGETWYYTGGPHNYLGGTPGCTSGPGCPRPWSSVDFAPLEVVSCPGGGYLPNRWVVAARGGNVVFSGQALVKIDHGDGWVTYYSHVSSTDRVGTGSISKGGHVGHPSCECEPGGFTSGIHLHFATAFNGVFQEINGTSLSGWTIYETTHYNGTMTCGDGRTRTASTSRMGNDIADNCLGAVDVALIIDSSGSMVENDPQDKRKEAARVFIGAMQDEDQVAVIDFDDDVHVAWSLQAVGSDRSGPMAAVDTIDSNGYTDIAAALQAGYDQLNSSMVDNPKAAVFLTDGDDTVGNSDADILNIAARYAARGWAVFTIGLIGSGDVNEALLRQIADDTGGQYFRLSDPEQLVNVYFEILGTVAGGTTILKETTSLQPGETKTFLVNLPPDQTTANFLTSWQGSTVDTTLIDPDGRVITPIIAEQDPNITHYKGLTFELYRITNPQPGDWQVEIYGADVPPGGEDVTIQVAVRGPGITPTMGGQILFSSSRGANPLDIYVMNADGTNVRRLTDAPGYNEFARVSHDGTKIAFESSRTGVYQVYTMNIDGSGVRQLTSCPSTGGCRAPDWSRDDSTILYSCGWDTCIMNADGSGARVLMMGFDYPRWSPDNTRILSTRWLGADGDWEIYVVNADGSNPVRLTHDPGIDSWPAWSPDGTKIVFTRTNAPAGGRGAIFIMNSDGSNQVRLTDFTDDSAPVFSPDGTKIAFKSGRDGNAEIYIMNSDGSNQTRLTNDPARDESPFWFAACGTVPTTPYFTTYYGDATLNGQPVPVGAVVEAYNPRGDRVGCFQVTSSGLYGYMRVYGEDATASPPIPGMRAGEEVTFKINGAQARPSTCPVRWQDDKTPHEIDLTAPGACPREQRISLHQGWNWVSFNRHPSPADVGSVLSSISGKYDLVLGEEGTYAPPPADPRFNTLTHFSDGNGYMLRMIQEATLTVTGDVIAPNTPIQLPSGWRWLGYLPESTLGVPTALASIAGKFSLLLGEAGTYAPPPADPRFNTLHDMAPGEGYMIRMTQDGTLTYPSTVTVQVQGERVKPGVLSQECDVPATPYFTQFYGEVTVDGLPAPEGTLVEALTPRGERVGCFEVTSPGLYGYMRVYGEDTSANPPIPGMRAGEGVTFKVNGLTAEATGDTVWQDDKATRPVDLAANTPTPTDTPAPPSTATPTSTPTAAPTSTFTYQIYLPLLRKSR